MIKQTLQLFLDMTRRSLQLIALWTCLVIPLVMEQTWSNTNLSATLLLWMTIIYVPVYFTLGLIRQYYDNKSTQKK